MTGMPRKGNPPPQPAPLASLEGLPDDVLAHVFEHLEAEDLVRLRVSRTLEARVRTFGIPLHLAQHPVHHRTLHPPPARWSPSALLALNGRISRSLQSHKLHTLQVGGEWRAPFIPALCLRAGDTEDAPALALAVGTDILLHPLYALRPWAPRSAAPAHTFAVSSGGDADIVGVHALPAPNTFVVAHFDGTLQRVELDPARGLPIAPPLGGRGARGPYRAARSTARYMHPRGGVSSPANIRALAGCGDAFLAASEGGARLFAARSPWLPPAHIDLGGARPWSAALTPRTAFVGVSGDIGVYALPASGPAHSGSLHGPAPGASAAYDVVPGDGRANEAHTVLSAWYDGVARLHDVRAGAAPVLELTDPWSDVAFYSAAFVGEHGVAAGGAQHGTVSVWDVRNPAGGWSVFSPAGRGSPVYALAGDGGRVWGVTERRAFVLAFDGGGDVPDGIVTHDGRGGRSGTDVPSGYGRRGSRVRWTGDYGGHAAREVSMGYRHGDRGMALFETEVPA